METCAEKLIHAFLELKHRTILTGVTWSGIAGDNSSIAIIYKQFLSLSRCMGLELKGETPEDIVASFEDGYFIKKRPLEKYATVVTALEEYQPQLKEYAPWHHDSFQFRYRQIKGLFIGLVSFKLKTDFRYYGSQEGLSTGSEYAHFLRMHALDKAAVKKIDGALGLIIDPAHTVFDMNRLVADFAYPQEDYETRYLDERINEEF